MFTFDLLSRLSDDDRTAIKNSTQYYQEYIKHVLDGTSSIVPSMKLGLTGAKAPGDPVTEVYTEALTVFLAIVTFFVLLYFAQSSLLTCPPPSGREKG